MRRQVKPWSFARRISSVYRRMRIAFLVLSVFGLALILAACSNEGSPTESPATSETADTVEPDPTASAMMEGIEVDKSLPPTVEGETIVEPLNPTGPRRGGVLTAPMINCPPPDPAIDTASVQFDFSSPSLVTEIHAGLTRIVDDSTSPFLLELADSYNVSADGLEYEFVLRNDLKFSDGSPLTAGEFKWSWERALKKSDAGGRARDVFGLVEGADAVILRESEDLTGVVVIDDRTLRVRLTNPRADFPALLADPVASVLKKDNALSWGIEWSNSGMSSLTVPFSEWNMPAGAGPFRLVAYWDEISGARCPIARNPHYWGEPAYLDGVWFRVDLTEWERTDDDGWFTLPIDPMTFVHEETDFEELYHYYVVEVIEDLEVSNDEETDQVVSRPDVIEVEGAIEDFADVAPTFIFAVLNAAAPPFDDIHFRRAAASIVQLTTFGGHADDEARLITGELTTLELNAEFIRHDPEYAQLELSASKQSGEEKPWEVGIIYQFGPRFTSPGEPSFRTWARELNLVLEDDPYGVQTLDEFGGRKNNDYHIRMFAVSPVFPDPVTVLRALAAPFGKINRAPEFVELDAMLADAATERDAVKRHEKYLAIEEYIAEQVLVIPIAIVSSPTEFRYHSWVHDLKPPKYPGSVFHKVWLDETAPKRELPLP